MGLGRAVRRLRRSGWVAGAVCAAAVCCAASAPARVSGSETSTADRARSGKHPAPKAALTPWEQAERIREDLEGVPEADRTRAGYSRAMDAYRAIYHDDPGDLHAAAAAYSVAELLAEQGHGMRDAKSLKAAIGQYEFLRKQYPGSSLRVQALLNEGQIAQNELTDPGLARSFYETVVKDYPRSAQAEEARAAIASLEPGPGVRLEASQPPVEAVRNAMPGSVSAATTQPPRTAQPVRNGVRGGGAGLGAAVVRGGIPTAAPAGVSGAQARAEAVAPALAQIDSETQPLEGDAGGPKRMGKRAMVTGIRHWSTATYTRVAIDLGDQVTYEAARVPNPDRIYFDLHGTRLAQELVGKSFAVTDDGFLKKIRAAQFSDDMTRIVLDVNDVTEYSAFLLPNPYRLIIDIHGRQGNGDQGNRDQGNRDQGSGIRDQGAGIRDQGAGIRDQGTQAGLNQRAAVSAANVPAPHAAGVVQTTAARPVPNTLAVKQASAAEVAAVSSVPGKVEATSRPTSQPISAVVSEGGPSGVASSATATAPSRATSSPLPADLPSPVVQPGGPEAVPAGVSIAVAPTSAAVPGDVAPRRAKKAAKVASGGNSNAAPARAAVPTADGETSLVRALGLKIGRIVIDAGHGGHDSGTLGVDGLEEKDVVLDVALRVGKLLHDRLGAEIIYTRSDDTFIPLETRTAIANKAQADLFLSIHANSSSDPSARGVETYYLNFTSDPSAIQTAARENAVSDQSIHQLSDLVKKIALKDKIAESREFASDVETSLYGGLARGNAGLKDRGVKKAPFVVLIGANMPSILAEISFVTNPRDAEELRNPEYRERVAESLFRGVARYEGGLSGGKVQVERAAVGQ